MADEFISLKRLAEQLGMDRSHARRYVLRLGFHPKKRRTLDSANQLTLTLTAAEAQAIVAQRSEAGFLDSERAVSNEHGVFYVVQLVPDLDPLRLKLGFAADMNERLSQHRTAAPTATCVRIWPCRRSWELAAIDCITRVGCRLIINEVYEADDVDAAVRRGDEFFSVMPPVELRPDLSPASPLRREEAE
ncbi:MAG: hypothetical protein AB1716_17590 [Planctomycetota bacterium]